MMTSFKATCSLQPVYKISWALIIAGLFFLGLPAAGWSLTGREVAVKMDQVDNSATGESIIIMEVERGGQKMRRTMNMKKKKFPVAEKQLIRFHEPSDIRDTSYLTWSYKDYKKDDDMWIYMPAESLVRRISGGAKKGSFMRSDYANEDISKREVDEDTHTLAREEKLVDVDCYVVEMEPVNKKQSNYSKRVTWIRKDIFLPIQVDFYDQKGQKIKQLTYGNFKEIQGIWTPTRQVMKTLADGSQTTLETANVNYNLEMNDNIFNHTDLKR